MVMTLRTEKKGGISESGNGTVPIHLKFLGFLSMSRVSLRPPRRTDHSSSFCMIVGSWVWVYRTGTSFFARYRTESCV